MTDDSQGVKEKPNGKEREIFIDIQTQLNTGKRPKKKKKDEIRKIKSCARDPATSKGGGNLNFTGPHTHRRKKPRDA